MEKVSTWSSVNTQVSSELPPCCIDMGPVSRLAMRVMPPAEPANRPFPSDKAYTRKAALRMCTGPADQTGAWA